MIHPQSRFFRNTLLPYKKGPRRETSRRALLSVFRLTAAGYCCGVVVCGVVVEGVVVLGVVDSGVVEGVVVELGLVVLEPELEPEPIPLPLVEDPEP